MKINKFKNVISKTLNINKRDINNVRPAGGMTNFNYAVTIQDKCFIIRIPGRGTDELVNRKSELKNLSFASSLGINPEHVYFDVKSGIKMTRKIKSAKTLTPQLAKNPSIQSSVIKIFQKLHRSKKQMKNEFQLFKIIEQYESLVRGQNLPVWREYKEIIPKLRELTSYYQTYEAIQKVPCHIDPSYTNFIMDKKGTLFLIDWEYSGMFDPLWDLAAFSLESNLTEQEEHSFLRNYFNREILKEEIERILLHKIFQDYIWSLWTFYKESLGSQFGKYGEKRFNRMIENIPLFHQI